MWFETLRKTMFFGIYTLPLNQKSQLSLPANYCEGIGKVVYITQGFDRNLFLLSQQAFLALYSHVKATSISDPMARLLSRLFLGGAVEIAMDGSGKIELPAALCEYAGLGKETVLVGQGEYAEIWSPSLWQKQIDDLNDHDANVHRFEKFHVSLV
jgi:MraZ protein